MQTFKTGFAMFIMMIVVLLVAVTPASFTRDSSQRDTTDTESPGSRRGHLAVYDADQSVVLILGGHARQHTPEREQVWSWNGEAWSMLRGDGPPPRTLAGGDYHHAIGAFVVHGGIDPRDLGRLGDTWIYSDAEWMAAEDSGPGHLDHHATAYDEDREVLVMFGGQLEDRTFSTSTWEFDGHDWTARALDGPPPRGHHAMTYDSDRGAVVLYGGIGENGRRLGDMWILDGKGWREITGSGPGPRSHHRMAYDSRRRELVLYGGRLEDETDEVVILEDTWIRDEAGWRKVEAPGPGPRSLHAMAYDASRSRVVLYGGSQHENDDSVWEWNGRAWVRAF